MHTVIIECVWIEWQKLIVDMALNTDYNSFKSHLSIPYQVQLLTEKHFISVSTFSNPYIVFIFV